MAIVIEQAIGAADGGSGIALPSWTPLANELVLVFLAERNELLGASISGNGLTFAQVIDVNETQGQCGLTVWRSMGASPSTGSISISNTSGFSYAIAIRVSGVDTSGTNGSGAIENTGSASTGATDNTNATVSITTTTDGARVVGCLSVHGPANVTLVDETSVSINNSVGSGGNTVRASMFYEDKSVAGSVTLLGSASLSSAREWALAAIIVKPPSSTNYNQSVSGGITPTGSLVRQVGFHLAGELTPASTLLNRVSKLLSGGLTPAGTLVKRV